MLTIERVTKEYPNCEVVSLNGGTGCNIYLPNNVVCNLWFKKRKYKTNRMKQFSRFADAADIFGIISRIGEKQLSHTLSAPVTIQEFDDKGTQACIDHIAGKYIICQKNGASNDVLTLLKSLQKELTQFL